jgi:hypothetical protein
MRRAVLVLTILICASVATMAQRRGAFNPERYQAEMEQFITREACLTPQEASLFFPMFRELQSKQRVLFDNARKHRNIKPADEASCREAILERDDHDLQIKSLQQQYHIKFMNILPASKVYDILRAEDQFHRQSFKRMAQKRNK